MSSPFIYEEPVTPDNLIGREKELSILVERAMDARNSRLEGPRRYGKTSLLRSVLAHCKAKGQIVTVSVNFLGVLTLADVTERIELAYSRQLDGSIKRWFTGFLRTWHPTAIITPGGVGGSFAPQMHTSALLERLAMPVRMRQRFPEMQCVIAFDEFQDVIRIPGAAATFRSELEQHGEAAAYIFSGSHPGMMRDTFADRRYAFYAQAAAVPLGTLDPVVLAEFISERFIKSKRDPAECLGLLLDLAEGHPQRAMQLAHHLYTLTPSGASADTKTWSKTLEAVFREAQSEMHTAWQSFTVTQQRVISVIASRDIKLNSAAAVSRFNLKRNGHATQEAVERLGSDGHIIPNESTATDLQVTDPLFGLWLSNGRSWPN
jgi:hypothetical protein